MRGKQEVEFDLKKADYERADFEKKILGPSGNLRAPAMRMGKTWLVGYSEETYERLFG